MYRIEHLVARVTPETSSDYVFLLSRENDASSIGTLGRGSQFLSSSEQLTFLFLARIALSLNRLPVSRGDRNLLPPFNLAQPRFQRFHLGTQAKNHFTKTRIQLHGT